MTARLNPNDLEALRLRRQQLRSQLKLVKALIDRAIRDQTQDVLTQSPTSDSAVRRNRIRIGLPEVEKKS